MLFNFMATNRRKRLSWRRNLMPGSTRSGTHTRHSPGSRL